MVSNDIELTSVAAGLGSQVKQDELTSAREAESESHRQLAILKSKYFDLRCELESEKTFLIEARAKIEDTETDLSTRISALEADCAAKDDQLIVLQARYEERLSDIAQLGQILAIEGKDLRRLKAEYEYSARRNHILVKLAQAMSKLHRSMSAPFYAKARRRVEKVVAKEIEMVSTSGLFDAEWYCESYPDVAQSGGDPLRHFILNGAYELRDPGPEFSAYKYHQKYPDVTEAGIPALLHFLTNGRSEGRLAFSVGESV